MEIKELKKILEEQLKKNNLTKSELAEKLNITPGYLSNWFSLRQVPNPSGLEKYRGLANFLNISTDEVIGASVQLDPSEKSKHFWNGFEKKVNKASNRPELYQDTQNKITKIILNLVESEEFVDVLIETHKTYIEKIKKWNWINNVNELKTELKRRSTAKKT